MNMCNINQFNGYIMCTIFSQKHEEITNEIKLNNLFRTELILLNPNEQNTAE